MPVAFAKPLKTHHLPSAFRGKAVALDIACGLHFLHACKPNAILHLDLVSCNLCLVVAPGGLLPVSLQCCLSASVALSAQLARDFAWHALESDCQKLAPSGLTPQITL